mgnify:FL=1
METRLTSQEIQKQLNKEEIEKIKAVKAKSMDKIIKK